MQPTIVLLAVGVAATLTSSQSVPGGFNSSYEYAASPAAAPGAACRFDKPAEPAALSNDNRTPAGSVSGGALEIRLVVRMAGWYPEGATGCGLPAFAFGEEGKPASIPGPLIRVKLGTVIRATVRNELTTSIRLMGLQDHARATSDTSTIAAGEAREFRFRVTATGTFLYRADTDPPPTPGLPDHTRQLVGAFIVDPPGPVPDDRVLVVTRWRKFVPFPARPNEEPEFPATQRILATINGLSWPHTERLSATVGDTLRWRVINADVAAHPLHLHGFYFRVTAQGDMVRDTTYDDARRRMAVTEVIAPWRTMALDWSPDRPGNWLFHCHMVAHMSPRQRLDLILGEGEDGGNAAPVPPVEPADHAAHKGHSHEMAGLILGITVRPRDSAAASTAAADETPRRKLRLFLQRKERVFGASPGYGFVLQTGSRAPAIDSIRIPGPELALTRGEAVEITLINRAAIPLSVHWHGIELESYFDGVAGWSGDTRRLAPPIAANDSFVVRFTPPRAGTFIYHVHDEGGTELSSGLYGPLIVRERGDDPSGDHVFVIADAGPRPAGATFINGTLEPDTVELVAGRTYRFRLIGITANGGRLIAVEGAAGESHPWRQLARDGWEGEFTNATMSGPARLRPGMTADFEFTPSAAGVLRLIVRPQNANQRQSTSVPIRVAKAESERR